MQHKTRRFLHNRVDAMTLPLTGPQARTLLALRARGLVPRSEFDPDALALTLDERRGLTRLVARGLLVRVARPGYGYTLRITPAAWAALARWLERQGRP